MIKYSIILPYYDRLNQLVITLSSFFFYYMDRNDYEVILIRDQKQTQEMNLDLDRTLQPFYHLMNIKIIDTKAKVSFSPSTAYNEGVRVSSGAFLIITNPECKHDINILSEMDKEFDQNPNVYIICGCKSLEKDGTMERWYQHSIKRNCNYHFCSGISKENYWKAGGFNERYTPGYGYDDNSFRDRIHSIRIPFLVRDDMIVSHQWHQKLRPMAYRELLQRNKDLYHKESKGLRRV